MVTVANTDPMSIKVLSKQSHIIKGKVNLGQCLNFENFLKQNPKRIIVYDTDPANEVYIVYPRNVLYFAFDLIQNNEGILFAFDNLKETEVLVAISNGQKFRGKINTFSYDRLSDCLTELEKFLVIYDVLFQGKDDNVLYINTAEITWIKPM